MYATPFYRILGGRLDSGMGRQTQIILRREIDAAHLVAAVVLREANRTRAVFGRARKGPKAVLTTQVLPFEKAFGAPSKSAPPGTRKSLMLPIKAAGGISALRLSDITIPFFSEFFVGFLQWGRGCRRLIKIQLLSSSPEWLECQSIIKIVFFGYSITESNSSEPIK